MALLGRMGTIPVKLLFIKECIIQKGKSRALCSAEEWSGEHLFPHPRVQTLTQGHREMEPELWLPSPNTAGKIIDQEIFISGENQLQLSPCPRCCWVCLGARSQISIPVLLPGWHPERGFCALPCSVLGRDHRHLEAEHPPPPSSTEILRGFPETSPGNKPKHKPSLTPRQKGN